MQFGLEALSPKHALRALKITRKAMWQGRCAYCDCKPSVLTIDHVVPIVTTEADMDADTPSNLVPACVSCNTDKGDQDAYAWYVQQEFFCMGRWDKINNKQTT
jgi:5-methylcytosine-specific restriction endonuclease McrA